MHVAARSLITCADESVPMHDTSAVLSPQLGDQQTSNAPQCSRQSMRAETCRLSHLVCRECCQCPEFAVLFGFSAFQLYGMAMGESC